MAVVKAFTCPVCSREVTDPKDVGRGFCTHCQVHTAAIAELVHHGGAMTDQIHVRGSWTQHYDRDGDPISFARYLWLNTQKEQMRYGILAQDELPHDVEVSTVWLGYDVHDRTPPRIYETAIFLPDELERGPYVFRWSTDTEALENHETFLKVLRQAGAKFLDALEELGL